MPREIENLRNLLERNGVRCKMEQEENDVVLKFTDPSKDGTRWEVRPKDMTVFVGNNSFEEHEGLQVDRFAPYRGSANKEGEEKIYSSTFAHAESIGGRDSHAEEITSDKKRMINIFTGITRTACSLEESRNVMKTAKQFLREHPDSSVDSNGCWSNGKGDYACMSPVMKGWCKGDAILAECDAEKNTATFTRISSDGSREEKTVELDENHNIFKDPGHEKEAMKRLTTYLESGMSPEDALENTTKDVERRIPIRQRNEELRKLKGDMRIMLRDTANLTKSAIKAIQGEIAMIAALIEQEQKRQEQQQEKVNDGQQERPEDEKQEKKKQDSPLEKENQTEKMGTEQGTKQGTRQEELQAQGNFLGKIKGYIHALYQRLTELATQLTDKINEMAQEVQEEEQEEEIFQEEAENTAEDVSNNEKPMEPDKSDSQSQDKGETSQKKEEHPWPVILGNVYGLRDHEDEQVQDIQGFPKNHQETPEPEEERNEMGETKEEHERMSRIVKMAVESNPPDKATSDRILNNVLEKLGFNKGIKEEEKGTKKEVSIPLSSLDGATFTQYMDLSGLGLTDKTFPKGCTFLEGVNISNNPELTSLPETTVFKEINMEGDVNLCDVSNLMIDENAAVIDPNGNDFTGRDLIGEEPELEEEEEMEETMDDYADVNEPVNDDADEEEWDN